MSRTDLNHWLMIKGTPNPDWDRGRERLALLTDEQIGEIANAYTIHMGGTHANNIEQAIINTRENIATSIDWLQEDLADPGDFEEVYKAAPGEWDLLEGEPSNAFGWHESFFMAAAAGVLQVMGFEVEGTNIPVYPKDMPVDYWPEGGVVGLWRPSL